MRSEVVQNGCPVVFALRRRLWSLRVPSPKVTRTFNHLYANAPD
jgi:hypothetical protein